MERKKCIVCKRIEDEAIVERFFRVNADRRGGNVALICPECLRLRAYSWENRQEKGVDTRGRTYSIEIEIMRPTVKAFFELAENGVLPSIDITVDAEGKTPIYHNLKSPVRLTKTMQRLIDGGEMVIDGNCGTHFHVGLPNNGMSAIIPGADDSRIGFARRFYHSLFVPVSDWMMAHPYETKAIFGRMFGTYARSVHPHTDAERHENFINVQHDYSLEFRLCFFANAAQYALAINTCDRLFSCIETHFWSKLPELDTTAARKAAAAKAARYMVRVLKKAAIDAGY